MTKVLNKKKKKTHHQPKDDSQNQIKRSFMPPNLNLTTSNGFGSQVQGTSNSQSEQISLTMDESEDLESNSESLFSKLPMVGSGPYGTIIDNNSIFNNTNNNNNNNQDPFQFQFNSNSNSTTERPFLPPMQIRALTDDPTKSNQEIWHNGKNKYIIGMHGAKGSEQTRLEKKYGKDVSGTTHESEHPIGFEPINHTSGKKRASDGRIKDLENFAPAYQEVKSLHRKHVGTGKGSPHTRAEYQELVEKLLKQNKNAKLPKAPRVFSSGFTTAEYREAQLRLMDDENPGTAVQLNQLGYAFQDNFGWSDSTEHKQANDSFYNMVNNVKQFEIAWDMHDEDTNEIARTNRIIHFRGTDKKEMLASRAVAKLGRNLVPTELSLLHLVTIGQLDYNLFLESCCLENFETILALQGLSSDKKIIMEQYWKERKQQK